MMKLCHVVKVEVIIGAVRTLEIGIIIEIKGTKVHVIEVIEKNLKDRDRSYDRGRSRD